MNLFNEEPVSFYDKMSVYLYLGESPCEDCYNYEGFYTTNCPEPCIAGKEYDKNYKRLCEKIKKQ